MQGKKHHDSADVPDDWKFAFGEVNGARTTPEQERLLHFKGIEHGHIYETPKGKRVKKEVF